MFAPDNGVFSLQRRTVPPQDRTPGVEYLYQDLASLRAGDLPAGIDLVIHQAVLIDDPGGPNDPGPMELLQADVTATLRLLTVARELGIPRFVHGSSAARARSCAVCPCRLRSTRTASRPATATACCASTCPRREAAKARRVRVKVAGG